MRRTFPRDEQLHLIAWRPLLADGVCWSVGLIIAIMVVPAPGRPISAAMVGIVCVLLAVLQALIGVDVGLYRGRAAIASFDELALLMLTSLAVAGFLLLIEVGVRIGRPVEVAGVSCAVAVAAMTAARFGWRWHGERRVLGRQRSGERTIVFGAGEGGYHAIRTLLRHPDPAFHPVALLDDDPKKRLRQVMGTSVLGDRRALVDVARRTGATVLLVAIPSASGRLLQELSEPCRQAGLTMKSVPSLYELIGGQARMGDIRDIRIADVLGRPASPMNPGEMAAYLDGKRVLVTGAGGSIGSELCRVLSGFNLDQLLMLDRDESALHAIQLSLEGRALLDSPRVILADIRDPEALVKTFDRHRPEVVFHAAALKHLALLERHPDEAIKTNVFGTLNVLAAAKGVSRFVNISTDKAADPISVLGTSKRIAERVVANGRPGTTCVSVRFGNVLGSRGSVLHTFAAQVKAGGPLTVTHPDATRYFMTVTEAAHLVIAAGGIGLDGEALVLDMGEPARILDVAKLVSADCPVPIEFTGLRPGEKLHEQLFGVGETDQRPMHPLISQLPVPALDPVLAYRLRTHASAARLIDDLAELVIAPAAPAAVRSQPEPVAA